MVRFAWPTKNILGGWSSPVKRWDLIFSLLIVSLAALSSSLWLKLRSERMVVEDLLAQQPVAPPACIAPWVEDRPAMAVPPTPDNGKAGACPPMVAQAELPTESIARMEALVTRIRESVAGNLELLNDPEYREARLAQMRISEARNNPGLVEIVGLSDTEARELFKLMAARELDTMIEISRSSSEGPSFSSVMETTQRSAVAQEHSVRALLGSEKYSKLIEYQAKVRPAYVQVASIEKTLLSAGQPLAEAQSRALKAALLEEHRRPRQPPVIDNSRPLDVNAIVQAQKAEKNRRALEAAMPHLSPAQLEALRGSLGPPSGNR